MGKQLAILISYAFHPLWMPLYVMMIFWNLNHQMLFFNNAAWFYILLVVFFNTLLIPLILIWLMKQLKLIDDLQLLNKKDRLYPFLVTGVFYITTWYIFSRLEVFAYLSLVFALAALLVFLALFINLFWKISIHSMSMGALSIMILYLSAVHMLPIWPVYGIFILSGLVAFSRLKLRVHNPAQIYTGFFLGIATVSLFFYALLLS